MVVLVIFDAEHFVSGAVEENQTSRPTFVRDFFNPFDKITFETYVNGT